MGSGGTYSLTMGAEERVVVADVEALEDIGRTGFDAGQIKR